MTRWIRRLLVLGALLVLVTTVVRRQSAQRTPPTGIDPSDARWPPFEPAEAAAPAPAAAAVAAEAVAAEAVAAEAVAVEVVAVEAVAAEVVAAEPPSWVEPVDGACPTSHPVKTNASSGIFHVPGGRSYERTKPERCYSTPEAAAADGYRPAKA
jgi:hypothetical protein